MDIIIDHKIRDWVFIPLILVLFMMSVFRHYLSVYQGNKKTRDKVTSSTAFVETSAKNLIAKCQILARNSFLLTESAFKGRRYFLCRSGEEGYLKTRANLPQKDALSSMSSMGMSQGMMQNMLGGQISSGIVMAIQYGYVSYLFSGFICGKVPFPLTQKFRSMLQRGVEINSLNVGYVSSLSLYFMVIFGINPFLRLLFSGDEDTDSIIEGNDLSKMGMPGTPMMGGGGGAGMPGQPPNFNTLITTEKDNLELMKHKCILDNSEDKCIKRLQKQINELKLK